MNCTMTERLRRKQQRTGLLIALVTAGSIGLCGLIAATWIAVETVGVPSQLGGPPRLDCDSVADLGASLDAIRATMTEEEAQEFGDVVRALCREDVVVRVSNGERPPSRLRSGPGSVEEWTLESFRPMDGMTAAEIMARWQKE
mgnify:CR=1 FL=1